MSCRCVWCDYDFPDSGGRPVPTRRTDVNVQPECPADLHGPFNADDEFHVCACEELRDAYARGRAEALPDPFEDVPWVVYLVLIGNGEREACFGVYRTREAAEARCEETRKAVAEIPWFKGLTARVREEPVR